MVHTGSFLVGILLTIYPISYYTIFHSGTEWNILYYIPFALVKCLINLKTKYKNYYIEGRRFKRVCIYLVDIYPM